MKHYFLLGAPRCGTTSIASWLDRHPEIDVSTPKEPKFFTRDYHPGKFDEYIKNCFRGGYPIKINACAYNLMVPYVPNRIHDHLGHKDVKFIVSLRHPLDRAFSHWKFDNDRLPGRTYPTFDMAMSKNLETFSQHNFWFEGELPMNQYGGLLVMAYIEFGLYYDQIMRYASLFGLENIHIVIFDDIVKRPYGELKKICDFLEVDEYDYDFEIKNSTVHDQYMELEEAKKRQIMNIWRPQIHRLSRLIKRDLVTEWEF